MGSFRLGNMMRVKPFYILLWSLFFCSLVGAQEAVMLKTYLDRQEISLKPASRLVEDGVWVPLDAFCNLIDVEAKVLEDGGPLAVCRDDLCIPLNGVEQDTVSFDGILYAALEAFGEPLGLKWSVEGDMLNVTSGNGERVGLGIGHRPPAFTLPDLYTGEPVSLSDYRGKKTVFYMWASW